MIWLRKLVENRSPIFYQYFGRKFGKCSVNSQQLPASDRGYNLEVNHVAVGSEIHGFTVCDEVNIPDFNCRLIKFHHTGTGAQFTHVERNDNNNVFAIAFRTTPFDSTGLPHILEHLTLMGSEKYPCRDPFFKMLNRSLATYINACTAADFTVYPFATQNRTDYYNLMSVYLDAVFRPKLRENDFKMEGWRLEHEEVTDRTSPIVFKGVVFNEMKGVFSENQNIFVENILNNLLPSHTYSVCSGGDPMVIPHLTHQNLIDFQRNHYHPSNCRIFSYGNFDFSDHLKFVHENYLKHYEFCHSYAEKTKVPSEVRWKKPRRKHIKGKCDPLAADKSKQSTIAISYLCEDVKNVFELFELKILSQLLIDGPNASFYKTLIEPNIGSGYAPATGFDSQTRDTIFTIGLQGVSENDFEKIETLVNSTFDECINDGFDETNIENILHGVELNTKHQGSDFGINLLFNISPLWNHDGNIINALKITEHVEKFRKNLSTDPSYLQKLVKKYFKNNSHCMILTMSPDENYEVFLQEQENNLLQQKLSELNEEEIEKIFEVGLELRKEQEKTEDISCLPTLKISDVDESCKFPNINFIDCSGVPVQLCSVPTNNVSYFRSLLDISELTDAQKSILPLFVQIVSQMGTQMYDYRTFDQMIYAKTLGLHVGVHVADDIENLNKFEDSISVGSLCLDKNVPDMFKLWLLLFNEVCLTDINRFSTLVRNIAGDISNGVADSGHRYAMLYASSLLSPANNQREAFGGLTFIQRMKKIAGTEDLSPLLGDMRQLADIILNKKRIRAALNLSAEQNNAAIKIMENFMAEVRGDYEGVIKKKTSSIFENSSPLIHFVLPFAVNYTSKAVLCVPYTDPDFATLRVLSKLITTKYLLPLVRERYGAYGSGAVMSSSGTFQFYSYRDPNSTNTINIFDEAADWLKKNEFLDSDIDEAKLGVFRDIDVPIAPSEQGMRLFLNGINDDLFAEHRTRILNVDRDKLLNAGIKYLANEQSCAKVIIGPESSGSENWRKIFSE